MSQILEFIMEMEKSNTKIGVEQDSSVESHRQGGLVRLEDARRGFKSGERYLATVGVVHPEGVLVRMPACGGSGVVSAKCWGTGATRVAALSALKPGDSLEVAVKSYDPKTKSLSLVLRGSEHLLLTVGKPKMRPQAKHHSRGQVTVHPVRTETVARKSAYQPLPKGTTLLFDTANLIGKFGPRHAARYLATLVSVLEERGYRALLFWEHRSFDWTWRNQLNAEDVAALKVFARRKNVSLVGEESDLAMLQAANEIPNSVIVTQDRLSDYVDVFPEIVTTSRHRSFSTIEVDGRIMLTIFGLKEAITLTETVEMDEGESVDGPEEDEWRLEIDADVLQRRAAPPPVTPCRHGLLGVADGCILHGDVRRGLAILGRVARKSPKIYRDMAEVFRVSGRSPADARKAVRYDSLADRREKALHERRRRNCRQKAERFRRRALESWGTAA